MVRNPRIKRESMTPAEKEQRDLRGPKYPTRRRKSGELHCRDRVSVDALVVKFFDGSAAHLPSRARGYVHQVVASSPQVCVRFDAGPTEWVPVSAVRREKS